MIITIVGLMFLFPPGRRSGGKISGRGRNYREGAVRFDG
jgi:hypothetical protein